MGNASDASKICLVVDDQTHARSAIRRVLLRHFSKILTAASASEAGTILDTEPVTHVVCDHFLGESSPLGTELLSSWRVRYPAIQRAVILTGTDVTKVPLLPGIDSVISKLTRLPDLLAAMDV